MKYNVYQEVNYMGIDGKVCNTLEDAMTEIAEFDTKEEAEKFIKEYNLQNELNDAVKEQGYGSVEVRIYAQEEDSNDQLFERKLESNQGDNATTHWEIRAESSNFEDETLEKFDNESKAEETFKNAINRYDCKYNREWGSLGNEYSREFRLYEVTEYGDDETLTEEEELDYKKIGFLEAPYNREPWKSDFCTEEDYEEAVPEWKKNVEEWRFNNDIDEDNVDLPRD